MRVVHTHESKEYILRPLWDGEAAVAPCLSWWGRAVAAFNDPFSTEGGPATTEAVAGLLDDRLHPRWADRLRDGATLDSCRLGRKPATFAGGVERSAVAGISGNFAPSKSISMLMVAGNEDVANLVTLTHHQAAVAALDFLQNHAAIARTGADLIGLLGVLDQRYTSKVANPHLSTTATIINAAPRSDGKWVTPQAREIMRWMIAMSSYVDAHMQRALAVFPNLRVTVQPADRLPAVISGAVGEELCQRYSADNSARRPLPTAPTRASVVTTTRSTHSDLTLAELRRRIQLDELVTLGSRQELPHASNSQLHSALLHAVARINDRYSGSSLLRESHLVSAALVGLIQAGPVHSELDHDVDALVHQLSEHHALRDRVRLGRHFTYEGGGHVAP